MKLLTDLQFVVGPHELVVHHDRLRDASLLRDLDRLEEVTPDQADSPSSGIDRILVLHVEVSKCRGLGGGLGTRDLLLERLQESERVARPDHAGQFAQLAKDSLPKVSDERLRE